MRPVEFIEKWRHVELKERTASHSHFIDLCHLLDIEDPITADPKGEWFTFEKGASKTTGGEGWADVWRKGCFAWEYKGKRKDLDKAFAQLLQYAIALENPPLLIVSDMDQIRINTNWTNTVQKVYKIALEDLTDAANRDLLRHAFIDPERLKPAKTRQVLTEEAARKFATLAERLRQRGYEPHVVAHFVNRLVFCMFAEDVQLLPNKMFERMLANCHNNPGDFETDASTLFAAMSKQNGKVGFEKVDWFNGGLFDNSAALPLERMDIADLQAAARLDWSDIDPSILGTLFERGLDPSKRSQLGAHYTDRDKIMQIVNPVIVEPLLAEWAEVRKKIEALLNNAPKATKEKLLRGNELAAATRAHNDAEALYKGFLERLLAFRVLDPACGSGNFLYIALLELKNIEHRVNLEAESLGFLKAFPRVGPEAVMGIELNSYAAELARVSVWIGEIQWMRRNGFEAARNPILRSLKTIENRDAVLNEDGTPAAWPQADVVVGNPPFLGNKKMIGGLGEAYTLALRKAYPETPGGVDLVTYWFVRAWEQIQAGKLIRAGLVSTNSIRSGASRSVIKPIVDDGRIFDAWSDQEWTVNGAAVRVSLICFDAMHGKEAALDGVPVPEIFSDLKASSGHDISKAASLVENQGVCFVGVILNGEFEIPGSIARKMLIAPLNVNGKPNSDVIRPTLNGDDFNGDRPDKWIIDFGVNQSEQDAALYEQPFSHVEAKVKPFRFRLKNDGSFAVRAKNEREIWWRHARPRPSMRNALSGLSNYIATPMVSSFRTFDILHSGVLPDQKLVVFARNDLPFFGILQSHFHLVWTIASCSWIGAGNDITYSNTAVFLTFPFPKDLTPDIEAANQAADPRAQKIAVAAARLRELRENWLNPPDLTQRVPEVVPGYPDRILPKDAAAETVWKKRTMTNLYSQRPAWLDYAHKVLDEAVAEAYGWGADWRAGRMDDDEILTRLFRLNQERASRGQ
ncbi:class I SAM-dependent DNA methyltransferase [Rhizobium rhizogenes]|uniref:class I SAM-dependent DNA methyltransferase n=1 Tax=Rhizobium rhizogenes TaxID=359 RepID=UPI001296FBE1|nr:DNA methyltransferase [Rhizobium rhizogenes]MQB34745.1 class I SAM-dependent DNA methyltransferase [Rhizobium rhizogenes]